MVLKQHPAGDPAAAAAAVAAPIVLWTRFPPLKHSEKMHAFTAFSCTLNEMTAPDLGCCPTDARFRQDKNLMEIGNLTEANKAKVVLEEAQRARRRQMEEIKSIWEPVWFKKGPDPLVAGRVIHIYKGGYWEAKEAQSWPPNVPSLYQTE
jgi:hypothetical protein